MDLSRFRTDEAGVTGIEYGLIWSNGELTGYPRVDQAAKSGRGYVLGMTLNCLDTSRCAERADRPVPRYRSHRWILGPS